ncbi:MAG: hemin uptake protein HemP [Chromatocurvus sp.]
MKECNRQAAAHGASRPREIESDALLGAERRVRILHAGQVYELRETRFGKLILTK